MTSADSPICVIIAAWRAEGTIATAIASALSEPEVGEVIVVDDASPDATQAAALRADDGSGRLRVLRQPVNAGPSAARNAAIAASRSPVLAILDADDFFLPGRLAPLLAAPNWDMIADNIAFIPEIAAAAFAVDQVARFDAAPASIGLADFIDGNISHPGRPRGELGFVKPLIRRAFLERHGLGYDPALRLGEDFALYVQMLAAGARFERVRRCGYAAIERPASLSGSHATHDLGALLAFDDGMLASGTLNAADAQALRRHRRQLAARFRHRRFLDCKREGGLGAAVGDALTDPIRLGSTALAILRDKTGGFGRPVRRTEGLRYLFS